MKVVFLDIDGVLKPLMCGGVEKQSADKLAQFYAKAFKRCGFDYALETDPSFEYKSHTIKQAIKRSAEYIRPKIVKMIRRVLRDTGAKIVVSSNWREGGYRLVKALLSMHGLERYIVGMTSFGMVAFRTADTEKKDSAMYEQGLRALKAASGKIEKKFNRRNKDIWIRERIPEIMDYLQRHQEITAYAVVDDEDYVDTVFGPHGIHTDYVFKENNIEPLKHALNLEDGPYRFPLMEKLPTIKKWHEVWDEYYAKRFGVNKRRI